MIINNKVSLDSYFYTFISLSSVLTGYTESELRSTGLAEMYYEAVSASTDIFDFIKIYKNLSKFSAEYQVEELQIHFSTSAEHHSCAKNIIKLWYLGMWNDQYVHPLSYQEALIWGVAGAHPPGVKQQGFGSWGIKPLHV